VSAQVKHLLAQAPVLPWRLVAPWLAENFARSIAVSFRRLADLRWRLAAVV
jgi:hypothetical protein